MLYGKMQVVEQEFKKQLCDLLQKKVAVERAVCEQVMGCFLATEEHVTVDELHGLLRARNIAVDRTVVKAALDLFSDVGFAQDFRLQGEAAHRYEHFHPQTHHDHFICIACRKISEFSDAGLEAAQSAAMARQGFKPLFHKLEVYGVCPRCLGQEKKRLPLTHVPEGSTARVAAIESGVRLKKRLTDLGFIAGEPLTVIKNVAFGPVVVEVRGARFAIGHGEAQKIFIHSEYTAEKR
ncbi:MAG: FeoA domain-containing protein [Candidatus Omnitrophica bacterium]|nr:FeoA domain-containing protein [Candidatus Omnitrophota bacterium]